MWHEILTQEDIESFMKRMLHFHDSCIKEMRYVSGASVGENLGMFPVNDRRELRMIIQRQFAEDSAIEMVFGGLKHMKLTPLDEEYTCEILGASMGIKDGFLYWCNEEDPSVCSADDDCAILIYAKTLQWRTLENAMGDADFYAVSV
ncbi:MAG: hypothetical protein IJA31_10460 [Clostridia bacterium]|nr:hypothetical protein [Clostridia bacterium]